MNVKMRFLLSLCMILILGLISGCGNGNGMLREFENCENEIDKKFPSAEISYPENYDSLCMQETLNNITFPRIPPSYTVLHFDRFYKPDIRLTLEQEAKPLWSIIFFNMETPPHAVTS